MREDQTELYYALQELDAPPTLGEVFGIRKKLKTGTSTHPTAVGYEVWLEILQVSDGRLWSKKILARALDEGYLPSDAELIAAVPAYKHKGVGRHTNRVNYRFFSVYLAL